jgi:hypothetical protein
VLSALIVFSSTATAAEVFRWRDGNGVIHYGDQGSAAADSKKVVIKDSPVVSKPVVTERTANTGADFTQSGGADDNMAKCASYARVMADNQGNSKWLANSKLIQSTCPGTGFECTTYNHHPEKNTCVPFSWNGAGSFFKDVRRDFPMNSRP